MDYKILIQGKLTEFHKNLPDLSYGSLWFLILKKYTNEPQIRKADILEIPDEFVYNTLCKIYVKELQDRKEDTPLTDEEWFEFQENLKFEQDKVKS
jgi:hypothetical protein